MKKLLLLLVILSSANLLQARCAYDGEACLAGRDNMCCNYPESACVWDGSRMACSGMML